MKVLVALSTVVLLAGCAHDPNGDVTITVPLHRLHHPHRPMFTKAAPVAQPAPAPTVVAAPPVVVAAPPAAVPVVVPVTPKPTRRARVKAYLKSRHILP